MLALVRALKRVDLPTFGRPTMPHFTSFLSEEGFQKAGLFFFWNFFFHFLLRRFDFLRRFGLLRLGLRRVQLLDRALHVARKAERQDLERAADRFVDRGLVVNRGFMQ